MTQKKTLKQSQKAVDDWINQFEEGYWQPLSQLTRLVEEVGELARLFNHLYGDKPKKITENKQRLEEEIGDLFFTLVCLANAQKIDLEDALDGVMKKLNRRDGNRWTKKKDLGYWLA